MPETDEFLDQLGRAYRDLPAGPPADPDRVRRNVRRRRRARVATVVAGAAVVSAVLTIGVAGVRDDPSGPLPVRAFGSAVSSESRLSDSARDWVRSTDAVVVGKVVSEHVGRSASGSHGSADEFVSRTVTVAVLEGLWEPAPVDVPAEVTIQAPGWVRSDGRLSARLAEPNAPRLEVGHTYVLALLKDRCGLDWQLLGSRGAIPYDDRTVGTGEVAGRATLATQDPGSQSALTRQAAGSTAAAIEKILAETFADQPARRDPPAC